jgi:hypothetical protein
MVIKIRKKARSLYFVPLNRGLRVDSVTRIFNLS